MLGFLFVAVAITPALIRISIGVEQTDDLIADLEQALAGVGR